MATAKDRVFRDPVHGLIEFVGPRRPIADLLDTRAMQRLRRIKQMGLAWLVYGGAEHSRFTHALGAYHIAVRIGERLGLAPAAARHLEVAALLHDIGHGPFSHAWEHVFPDGGHEAWGARILADDAELRAALSAVEPGLPATLEAFWRGDYQPHWTRKLVSSQLDVDRLDYLLRDGHFSGVGYATYDLDWIIHAISVAEVPNDDGTTRTDLVIDYRRGMYAVEQYLFARAYMYAQVYHHKTVRAAEWGFIKLMQRFAELTVSGAEPPGLPMAGILARGGTLDVPGYLRLHDAVVQVAMDRWAEGDVGASGDPVLIDLARRMTMRRLMKAFDLGDDPTVMAALAVEASAIASRHFGLAGRYYVHVDSTQNLGYKASSRDELHVIGHPRYGTVTLGRLLADMPLGQPQAAIRLLCAPELVDDLRPLVAARVRG